jgi:hypothetical protein
LFKFGKKFTFFLIEQEILESGSYMLLRDGQVRKLMVEKTIMEYNITVHHLSSQEPTASV